MGATTHRSKGRPVRSLSRTAAYDDNSDVDASYNPKKTRYTARKGQRRQNDNDDRVPYAGGREARPDLYMRTVEAVSRRWRRLSPQIACLAVLVAPVLILIAACITLSMVTDFAASSAYAIACHTPTSWIRNTGLPWLFKPGEACTRTARDPYEDTWDDFSGTTALLEISETSQQLQETREASKNYSSQITKFHRTIEREEQSIRSGEEVLVLAKEWQKKHETLQDSLDAFLVKDIELQQRTASESYRLAHYITQRDHRLAISRDLELRYTFTALLFRNSPGADLAHELDDMGFNRQMWSDIWEEIYTLIPFLYPYSAPGEVVAELESFAHKQKTSAFQLADAASIVHTALEDERRTRDDLIALLPKPAWQQWETTCYWRQHKVKAALLPKAAITGSGEYCEGVDFKRLDNFLSGESGVWISKAQSVVEKIHQQYTRLGEKYRESITTLYIGRKNPRERQLLTDSIKMNVRNIRAEMLESAEMLEAALKT